MPFTNPKIIHTIVVSDEHISSAGIDGMHITVKLLKVDVEIFIVLKNGVII